ncbi:hypothetical protein [Pedobacter sp. SL55]|uniref:hypothetical protein n=1 Tax=Pedobacter sp. SL55 TaxID=2995161 RepID=UPI002270E4D0|nr:hypothetical protein [Pedobacter sp. SL55]WAC40777.1 hypothetical protein OVA16_19775 [Pedobacter sp. SL55]
MSKMADNMEWENEAPQLAKLKKSNPFTVPSNYFEGLEERINQSVFISALQKNEDAGFVVPANYFETLENQITSRISLEQLKTKTQGFSVPEGYFEKLQQNIVTKTTETKKTLKLWHQPLFKYAVAACLVIASTAGWFANEHYQNNQLRKTELAKEQMLYDIDESVIMEYMQEAQNVKTASFTESEMENYILDNFSTNDLSNNL